MPKKSAESIKKNTKNVGTKQPKEKAAKKVSPISGTPPPDGFEKHPERRNNGAWQKVKTSRYWMEKFAQMNLQQKIEWLEKEFDVECPKDLIDSGKRKWMMNTASEKLTDFQMAGLNRALKARSDYKVDEFNLNRLEGTPTQTVKNIHSAIGLPDNVTDEELNEAIFGNRKSK